MRYTATTYNICRLPLSERRLEAQATYDASSPLEAAAKLAENYPKTLLGFFAGTPEDIARDFDIIYEGPDGVASHMDGDILLLVFPEGASEKKLLKEVAAWEAGVS